MKRVTVAMPVGNQVMMDVFTAEVVDSSGDTISLGGVTRVQGPWGQLPRPATVVIYKGKVGWMMIQDVPEAE
jgi:hypothetical protein